MVQSSGTAIYEGSNWSTTVYGTTAAYFEVQSWKADTGRLFMPEEEEAGKPVCIIGNTVRTNLFQSRSEEHTSELQSLMRISYAVFCLKKKKNKKSTKRMQFENITTTHKLTYRKH